jgi:phosphoribosyl 1,2-cyclic phosphodiesterase
MRALKPLSIKFHGVRGSRPVHRVDSLKTGGNSTCIEIVTRDDFRIFVDGGTGLANAFVKAPSLPKVKKFHIMITHTHWDHVLGLIGFEPLFDESAEITFYASHGSNGRFENLFKTIFSFGHSGLSRDPVKAKVVFIEVKPDVPFVVEDSIRVEGLQVNHQAVTLGYKFSRDQSSCAVVTDMAPIAGNNLLGDGMAEEAAKTTFEDFQSAHHTKLIHFLSNVNTLILDTHFNEENMKPSWGHQTPEIALSLCEEANVKQLFMFHHAPEDDDLEVDKKLQKLKHRAVAAGIKLHNAVEENEWPLKSA